MNESFLVLLFKKEPLSFFLVLSSATPAFADQATLLAAAHAAAGGDAWASIRTLHIASTLQTGDLNGGVQTWQDVAAGRIMRHATVPRPGELDGFDGISPWTMQDRSQIAWRLGDADAKLNAANESYRVSRAWWFPDRHDAVVQDAGAVQEGRRRFDLLRIMPEAGRAFTLWIDDSTHFVDRTVEQQAQDLEVTRYADYRPVGGIMLPFTVRTGDGLDPQDDDIERVEHIDVNPAIPDRTFDLPAATGADGTLPEGAASVTVPIRLQRNEIIVPLSVNGQPPVDAEFDSGGHLILQPALLARLRLAEGGRIIEQGGGEGSVVTSRGMTDTVSIGGATLHGAAFKGSAFNKRRPDWALVGLEFLQRFVIRLDSDRMAMTLSRPGASNYCRRGTVLPFHFQDNEPEISGTVDGVAGVFTIDTGDDGSLDLLAPFARRYGIVARAHAAIPNLGQATTATHGVIGRAGEVRLDGADGRPAARVRRPVTYISLQQGGFDADPDVSGIIGLNFLKQYNVTFDYRRQQIILEPNHLYGTPDIFNRAGFRADAHGHAWKVTAVYPGSPADAAGLRPDDEILRIDGKTPGELSDDDLDVLLKGPIGTPLSVMVGGNPRQAVLRLRDLI